MKKLHKKILLLALSLAFLTCAPLTLFYINGYRFDFASYKIVHLGGLYLKSEPSTAKIYINDRLIKKTNPIFSSVFLNNLLPGDYHIRIERDNYQKWEKILTIEESMVTEAKNILLIPQNINFSFSYENIKEIFFSPSGRFSVADQGAEKEERRILLLSHFDSKISQLFSEDQLIPHFKIKKPKTSLTINEVIWSGDEKKIIFEAALDKQKRIFLVDISQNKLIPIEIEFSLKSAKFNPQNQNEIVFIGDDVKNNKKDRLWTLDEQLNQISLMNEAFFDDQIMDFSFLNGDLILLGSSGFLYKTFIRDHIIIVSEILNLKPLEMNEKSYKIFAYPNSRFFVLGDENLYYINPKTHIFYKVSENVNKVLADKENRKISILKGNQIEIFYLEKEYEQPHRQEMEIVKLAEFKEPVNEIFWLGLNHLIFSGRSGIFIIEIDDRKPVNIWQISEFNNAKILWIGEKKTLFVLEKDKFYSNNEILR